MVWVPYPNFRLSVHVLDSQRLGVQIGQCLHILRMLAGHREGGKDRYHATTMAWSQHPEALCMYTEFAIDEVNLRGHKFEHPSPRSPEGLKVYGLPKEWKSDNPIIPEWIGIERIHASHRSRLLKKDFGWYSQFAWTETPMVNVQWPGKMPRVGDYVVNEKNEVCIIHCIDNKNRFVVMKDGELYSIDKTSIHSGEWRRCVSRD